MKRYGGDFGAERPWAPEPKRPHWAGGADRDSEFGPPRDYGPPSRGWDGPPRGPPSSGPPKGRGPPGADGPQKQLRCTLHDKMRTESNLEQDAEGHWKCLPSSKCRNTGDSFDPPPSTPQNQWKAGDWECPMCGDHQFAKNSKCRMCECPRPAGGARGGGGRGGGRGGGGRRPPWESDFRAPRDYPPPRDDWGPPRRGGWGPPAGDWGPPRDNWGPPGRGGGGRGGGYGNDRGFDSQDWNSQNEWKSGDWKCPSCGDHQFARNTSCRMCSCPKPEGGGQDLGDYGPPRGGYGRPRGGFGGGGGRRGRGAGVCHNWADTGYCRFGDGCKFSHSDEGQKQVQCTEHGKMRTDSNLEPDGKGGFSCRADSRCRNAGDGPTTKKDDMRPGDWRCDDCNEHNFASRTECRSCRKPKPVDEASAATGAGIFD